ncbi:3'-5' RNA exonuclease complex component [Sorochytrium milnesiophthora]
MKSLDTVQPERTLPVAVEEVEDEDALEAAPGDLVVVRRRDKSYVGVLTEIGPPKMVMGNGFYYHHRYANVWYRIPSFATVPPESDAPAMQALSLKVKAAYQSATTLFKRNLNKLNAAYDHFHTRQGHSTVKLAAISQWAFGNKVGMQPEAQLAVFLHSLQAPELYLSSNASHKTASLRFRNKDDVECIRWARELFRLRQLSIIDSFIDKCRTLRKQRRSFLGDPHAVDASRLSLPKFNADDIKLLRCVKAFALTAGDSENPFAFVSTSILNPLEYSELDKGAAQQLLVDIGIMYPWENFLLLEAALPLEGHGVSELVEQRLGRMSTLADGIAQRSALSAPALMKSTAPVKGTAYTSLPLTPDQLFVQDPCDHIRHDFGNLRVYTIDDASAKEIDDGVSIEYLDSADGRVPHWVHIHIADPTAYVPLAHPISEWARERVQTIYFPEGHYSMLPQALSRQTCSIGRSQQEAVGGDGDRVLTFSFQLGSGGRLADFLIRPAIVRNVRKCEYDSVDTVLNWDTVEKEDAPQQVFTNLPGTEQSSATPSSTPIDPETAADMRALQQVAHAHFLSRMASGCFNLTSMTPDVHITPYDLPVMPLHNTQPVFTAVRPTIRVSRDRSFQSPSRVMVAEMMIIGGRIASLYSTEHKLTLPFRTQEPPSVSLDFLQTRDKQTGQLPFLTMMEVLPYMRNALHATSPGQHHQMGILDGYSKVTSPLRRYVDMIAHHQLKACMLGLQAPFTESSLADILPEQIRVEKVVRALQRSRVQQWTVEMLRQRTENLRAMINSGQASREQGIYRGRVERIHERGGGYSVALWDIGIRGFLKTPSKLSVGDWVNVDVASVNLMRRSVDLNLV